MYLIGRIVFWLMTVGYVHACGRSDRVDHGFYGNQDYGGTHIGYRVQARVQWNKRAAEHAGQLYHLQVETSPCHFLVYDTDRDGVIIYDEMRALFEDKEVANRLFFDLDSTTGDNVITHEEFNLMAPKIIYACAPDAQEDVPEEPSHDDGDSNKAYA